MWQEEEGDGEAEVSGSLEGLDMTRRTHETIRISKRTPAGLDLKCKLRFYR
jgi:hypothetical protein